MPLVLLTLALLAERAQAIMRDCTKKDTSFFVQIRPSQMQIRRLCFARSYRYLYLAQMGMHAPLSERKYQICCEYASCVGVAARPDGSRTWRENNPALALDILAFFTDRKRLPTKENLDKCVL